jgi:Dyp-type peroxidase family
MVAIEWRDVQALVRRGLGNMPHASYTLLRIGEKPDDKARVRRWLGAIVDKITTGADVADKPARSADAPERYVNVAFTHTGLEKLGLTEEETRRFPREFREGMAPAPANGNGASRRSGMLGDVGPNEPKKWWWGGPKKEVDLLLMTFAKDGAKAKAAEQALLGSSGDPSECGFERPETIAGYLPEDGKEHFGFRDGISQPVIRGSERARRLGTKEAKLSLVNPGEIVLGYPNERELLPPSPAIDPGRGAGLPEGQFGPDLGRNGTYLVFRQLKQDVDAFNKFLDDQSVEYRNMVDEKWKESLAAKLVGRWKNGAPLTRFPDADTYSVEYGAYDNPHDNPNTNEFFFSTEDPDGLRCPIGSHIRRANPRDSLGSLPRMALRDSKRHRILRRGRNYGSKEGSDEKGLLFICLNTSIATQFEKIQHDWLNNPQFAGLFDERDPLLGQRSEGGRAMTLQSRPANLRFPSLGEFITVRGGAYFFLPSIRALRWLASAGQPD